MDAHVQPVGVRSLGQGEVESVVVGLDAEQTDIARRGGQRTVEVAGQPVEGVELAVQARTGVDERHLVVEALRLVDGAHLRGERLRAFNGQVAFDDPLHALPERVGVGAREFVDPLQFAVETARTHRVPDVERMPGKELARRLLEDEPRRALIDADALERGDVHEADRDGGVYAVTELFDAVVHERGQEGARPGSQAFRDLEQRGSHRDLQLAAEVFADDFDRIGHE